LQAFINSNFIFQIVTEFLNTPQLLSLIEEMLLEDFRFSQQFNGNVDHVCRSWHCVDADISEILTISTFKWLALQLHIQEVPDSNLSPETSYRD
jgi:hypothetical protein